MRTNKTSAKLFLPILLTIFTPLLTSAKVIVNGIGYELIPENNTAKVTSENSSYFGDIVIPSCIVYQGSSYQVTDIGSQAFAYCNNLNSVSLPEGLRAIGNWAFRACTKLTSITIPSSVEKIGQEAFYHCKSLASLIIPQDSKLTTIDAYAFENCDSLVSVFIPSSVEKIEIMAFSGISNLSSLVVDEKNKFYDSRNNCNAIIETISNKLISGCGTTVIPEGITSIGEDAFRECSNLMSITIPQSVSEICSQAFLKCENLETVFILGKATIGINAFKDCNNLTSITLPDNVTNIGNYAFKNCSSLTSITIPNGVTSIGYEVFYDCGSLTSITSKAVTPPSIKNSDTFYGVNKSIPVYVPAVSVEAYKSAEYWSDFSNIIGTEKCATPIISYENGKVKVTCDTEGAVVKTKLDIENDMAYESLEFDLIPTYTLTAYATKDQHEDSDVATLTLCWIPCDGQHMTTEVTSIPSKPVFIQSQGGTITLSGLADDIEVAAYDLAGELLDATTAIGDTATLSTNLNQGDVVILKIGNNSIKIVVK